jgi:hypothetical protein
LFLLRKMAVHISKAITYHGRNMRERCKGGLRLFWGIAWFLFIAGREGGLCLIVAVSVISVVVEEAGLSNSQWRFTSCSIDRLAICYTHLDELWSLHGYRYCAFIVPP